MPPIYEEEQGSEEEVIVREEELLLHLDDDDNVHRMMMMGSSAAAPSSILQQKHKLSEALSTSTLLIINVIAIDQTSIPSFIRSKTRHTFVAKITIIRADGGDTSHAGNITIPSITELQLPNEIQNQQDCMLEIEVLASTEKIDVSLGVACIGLEYYLSTGSPQEMVVQVKAEGSEEIGAQIRLGIECRRHSVSVPIPHPAGPRVWKKKRQPQDKPVRRKNGLLEPARDKTGEEVEGGPKVISKARAPSGFYFDELDREVDWDRIRMAKLERIVQKGDVESLLDFLPDVVSGDASGQEGFEGPVGQAVRLSQYSIQYVTFCQKLMAQQCREFEKGIHKRGKMIRLRERELESREAMIARLKKGIHASSRLLRTYDGMLRACRPHFAIPSTLQQEIERLPKEEEEAAEEGGELETREEPVEGLVSLPLLQQQQAQAASKQEGITRQQEEEEEDIEVIMIDEKRKLETEGQGEEFHDNNEAIVSPSQAVLMTTAGSAEIEQTPIKRIDASPESMMEAFGEQLALTFNEGHVEGLPANQQQHHQREVGED